MYIWVVIATFIAILYSFNLSPREDIRAIYNEPLAEAVVTKMVVQHKAANKYIRDRTPPQNGMSNITYNLGILSIDQIKNYLPYAVVKDGNLVYDEEFESEIYCLNKENHSVAIACTDPDSVRYLVTYGVVPQRWINMRSQRPNNDLLNAMSKVVTTRVSFGYAEETTAALSGPDKSSTMRIKAREKLVVDNGSGTSNVVLVYIPPYIIKNGGFATTCGAKRDNVNTYCLVYMTTYEG